ncbi:MAG: cytochrome C oxidase subunit IV family protein [Thermoanaerobaculia bacterium]|jgi:cytochrome c oxidase subunit IV|nr:cytochrome C oxidase subunit IV family protein [Thermoanaerobaculia bacterium]
MSVHVEPVKTYVMVFSALMVLTVATVFVAYFDLGLLNNFVAMGIALTKASLVVLIFMHVRHGSKLTKMIALGGFLWLIFLFLFPLADYDTRGLLGPLGK